MTLFTYIILFALIIAPFFILTWIDSLMNNRGKYQGYWESDWVLIPFVNLLYVVVCIIHAIYIMFKKES